MCRSKEFGYHFILLPIVLLLYLNDALTVASSTPKNLVNLNTPDDNSNSTTSSQFQNEYQYRQTASKASSLDRYKSSTSPAPDLVYDHLVNDLSSLGATDYSYQDNRAMTNVPDCKGRIKLNGTRGYITDGSGYYQTNLQCTWLIDSGRNNSIIRIQLHQFNTECNYDFLYIFDGDSIYAPLVTALSGDMKDFSTHFMEPRIESMISGHDNQANSSSTTLRETFNSPITSNTGPIEFSTKSGKAFVYFHSDTAQSMPGFYMTYSIDSCPLDCSNRGECDYSNLTCRCNSGYYGDACQYTLCSNDCISSNNGTCGTEKSCICLDGWSKANCSQSSDQTTWTRITVDSVQKAFHQSAVVDNIMWVFGGRSRELSNANMGIFKHKKTQMVLAFDLERKKWVDFVVEGFTGEDHLAELSGHSAATFGKKIFIYGGLAMNNTILDSLTVFDTKDRTLASLNAKKKSTGVEDDFSPPIASVGHSSNIIDGQMFVFLGYNPIYGYLNFVQKFNIANNSWSIIRRKGSSVVGCIGHSSTYDQAGGLVYIFGGHNMLRSKNLYSFDPRTETWTFLVAGPSPRYYHSSTIIDNNLVIFGGNSYNISHQSDQCFQQSYLLYDLNCSHSIDSFERKSETSNDTTCSQKCWQAVDDPAKGVLKRYGHSVVKFKNELILFGGFNGIALNDIKMFSLTNCSSITSEIECSRSRLFTNCSWDNLKSICRHEAKLFSSQNCTKNDFKTLQFACESRETCTDCLNTNFGCVWCDFTSQCHYKKCKSLISKAILDSDLCHKSDVAMDFSNSSLQTFKIGSSFPSEDEMDCKVDNCYLCYSKSYCYWQNEQCSYNTPVMASHLLPTTQDDTIGDLNTSGSTLIKSINLPNQSKILQKLDPFNRSLITTLSSGLVSSSPYHSCDLPCYLRRSCNECTTTRCIWCSTSEQCIDSSAYFAYHTMGQCMHYVAHMLKCPVASCADIETCDKCLTNPKCGWLNDISNTGKGRCIEGDTRGPSFALSEANNSMTTSALPNWHYTSCPLCQCNGHSFCKANNNVCIQPCQDNTDGPHCDRCIPGYFGDPVNGGSCRPCRCNGHAQSCNRETGKCYCSTKGIIGHNCNRCDEKNYYIGDPTSPANGTCYYNLTTDYQYTFNMSKPEDHFYSDINFINVPLRKDSDVDFTIACSRLALVNITSGFSYKNRRLIHANLECGTFRLRFPHDRHALTDANYSFFVHVYKFQTPFILQIAFSQHRTLYLPQFFFTFSSSFLFFFALSGLFWKLKHEYDLYMRRQRQFIEMEQMASRPFSTILLELFRPSTKTASQRLVEPTPISFEPCFGNNVGVLSLFVQLPGRPNLAIGSALVSLSDDSAVYDDENHSKRTEKSNTSVKNL